VTAFRRLSPADYGHFLAMIETDLGACPPELLTAPTTTLLLTGPAPVAHATADKPVAAPGSLREAVLSLLADGRARSTMEIRSTLEASRSFNPGALHTEIFTLRKAGRLRSEGKGRGTRHTLAPSAAPSRSVAAAGKREPATRTPRRKRDDDEDHPEPPRESAPNAEQIYASAISNHHLLTGVEERELSRRLEEVEVKLWERLIAGPLAAEAHQLLLELDPPVDPASAHEARTADLDRLVASRVIALRVIAEGEKPDRLAPQRAEMRAIAAEADRIRGRFATCNLRLVPSTIRRHGYHHKTNLSMSDLIQEGNFGLLKAISRFDYRRGLRFSTFATWWIRHYLVRARQNLGDEVRVPVHLQELAGKVRRAKIQLRQKLGRTPNQSELAIALKVSAKSLQALERDWPKYREALPSFDSVGGEEGEQPSYLASEDPLADEVLVRSQEDDQIAVAVAHMPALLAQIVRRRFGFGGEPETLIQIGKSMQLSRERIRQLEKKALAMLRGKLAEMTDIAA
jgi:RNA polymerase primary sigma factor